MSLCCWDEARLPVDTEPPQLVSAQEADGSGPGSVVVSAAGWLKVRSREEGQLFLSLPGGETL